MFTGIITQKGKVASSTQKNGSCFLTIATPKGWKLTEGESIATDGVCLTVKKIKGKMYEVELMQETLRTTTFGTLIPHYINLEQSLRLSDRLSGHFVTGHIDTVGIIKKITPDGDAKLYTISFPKSFRIFIIKKGSICVDGISLTVIDVSPRTFSVAVLPYTLFKTTLGNKKAGEYVNLEFDLLAKYAQNNKK
jgi:riboflavin synthase